MRAWTVDADDIQIADDLDAALLHRTPWIESFLELKGSDRFIVTATKGFGKTLLLKAKRISYGDGQAVCIPENGLLDKPIGDTSRTGHLDQEAELHLARDKQRVDLARDDAPHGVLQWTDVIRQSPLVEAHVVDARAASAERACERTIAFTVMEQRDRNTVEMSSRQRLEKFLGRMRF